MRTELRAIQVFQTYQRYNFESKSQPFDRVYGNLDGCFRPTKDTILRANHNAVMLTYQGGGVFQTYQRYNFESKSQRTNNVSRTVSRCFRPTKDTILRANHNSH